MAPSRKQKSTLAAPTPPETPRNAGQIRRRSASPLGESTPVRTRDEPPARSTRSWTQAPAFADNLRPIASQKNSVDCPNVGCSASTVHQHHPHLQYYLPRPGKAVYRPGYGLSNGDILSAPSLILTLQIPKPGRRAPHAQSKTAGNDEEVADTEPSAQESKQVSSSLKAARGNQEALATLDSPTANALPSTHRIHPPTPPPSSPLPASEAHLPHSPQQTLSDDHSQPPPASPAMKPDPDTPLQSQEPQSIPTTTLSSHNAPLETPQATLSHPQDYTYDELIRPLANPTAPPAPGMAHLTQVLQDLSRDMETQRHRVGETEYMRQCREYDNEYDNRLADNAYLQDSDEGFGGEEFDWDTYMWQ